MKTHKTLKLGELQTGGSKNSIVVSSLAEARFFAEGGFSDILYGVPVSVDKIDYVFELNRQFPTAEISTMIDNRFTAERIMEVAGEDRQPFGVFLKVNCDNGRAGVWWDCDKSIEFAKWLEGSKIPLKGIYAHCGNTYGSGGSVKVIKSIANLTAQRVLSFREKAGLTSVPVGIGSTPSCSVASDHSDPDLQALNDLDEFHPGNYVLYDLMQCGIGSCEESEVAGIVLARVISLQRDGSVIIDCGFTGISKQGIGLSTYNKLKPIKRVVDGEFVSSELEIEGLSQEHGRLVGSDTSLLKIGDVLGILPWHSCAVGALHPFYCEVSEGKCTDILVPVRGWI